MRDINFIRTEIDRMRTQAVRQRKEILSLQRAGINTSPAKALLAKMLASIDKLREERDRLKKLV